MKKIMLFLCFISILFSCSQGDNDDISEKQKEPSNIVTESKNDPKEGDKANNKEDADNTEKEDTTTDNSILPVKDTVVDNSKLPLYVIDGFPVLNKNFDLNTLEPSTIKAISVLKDEAATSIYGEKGKNGVVLIELKSGLKNSVIGKWFLTFTDNGPVRLTKNLNCTNQLHINANNTYKDVRYDISENEKCEVLFDVNGTYTISETKNTFTTKNTSEGEEILDIKVEKGQLILSKEIEVPVSENGEQTGMRKVKITEVYLR